MDELKFLTITLDDPVPRNSHVMLNPVIVNSIVEYLKVPELKNCRLLEKTVWLSAATRMLKIKGIICFDGHYDEEEEPDKDEYRDLQHYLRNISHFQTESYALGKGAKITECEKEYKIFFQKYGAGIKHLRIDYEFHSHFNVKVIRELLTKSLPNLEILDIRNMPVAIGQMTKFQELLVVQNECIDRDPCLFPKGVNVPALRSLKRIEIWNYNAYPGSLGPIFIQQLLELGTNVNAIKIVDRYSDKIVEKVLNTIDTLPILKSNLKELDFDCHASPTENDLKTLTRLNLKLDILRLGVICKLQSALSLQELLASQNKTLVELQFSNIKVDQVMTLQLPRFEKLESLVLTTDIPNGSPFGFSFGRISYKDTFPMLKKLSNIRSQRFYQHDCMETNNTYCRIDPHYGKKFFTGMGNLWKELFPENGMPYHGLVNLDISYPSKLGVNSKFYIRLMKMFPEANNGILRRLKAGWAIRRAGYKFQYSSEQDMDGGWVKTVHLLMKAVELDLLPGHPEVDYPSVKRDYGFDNCKSTDEESKLLSVYTAVMKLLECDLNGLHEACISGKLAEFIISMYKSTDQMTNFYCCWFLKNMHLVDNPYPLPPQEYY